MTARAARRPVRVLHVAETIQGGIATYLSILQAGSAKLDCDFHYLIPASQSLEVDDSRVHRHGSGRTILGIASLCLRTVKLSRKLEVDVVYAHSTFAGIAILLARLLLGRSVTIFYCPHGWAQFREQSAWAVGCIRAIERLMSFVADRVINISSFEHERVMNLGFSRHCVLIPNTVIDTAPKSQALPSDGRRLRVLFVGRFDRQKGVDILFEAILMLERLGIFDVEFDIVGKPILDALSVRGIPNAGNVYYHGWVDQVELIPLYRQADVLVMPSRWEGFGLCALEAFRAGTAVLASRVGGLTDIITEGVDGYFFDGTASGLVEVLMGLSLEDIALKGAAARRTYEDRFHPNFFFERYGELFALAKCGA
jgi:glycosyltransferase involved in cell wall biosynthesis